MYLRGDISILVPAVFRTIVAILTAPAVILIPHERHIPFFFPESSDPCQFLENVLLKIWKNQLKKPVKIQLFKMEGTALWSLIQMGSEETGNHLYLFKFDPDW